MDLRGYLEVLEKAGRLHRVKAEVDKDWELSCVARHVTFLPMGERYTLLFERVKGYQDPVVVGAFDGTSIYALGLGVEQSRDAIHERWIKALDNPLEPMLVEKGPVKENVFTGKAVDLEKFPVPTWTPPLDPGPYISAGCIVMKDPETGIRNVGTYRLQVKGKDRLGILILPAKHSGIIYSKYESLSKPMDVAIILGPPPTVSMTSVARIPYGMDEFAVAGALQGQPLNLVKCETVDIEVPADSEIVIEGVVQPRLREHEGPFGEFSGYMGPDGDQPYVEVTAVTHRHQPVYQAFIEQKPPSEGSFLKDVVQEVMLLRALRNLGIPGVQSVYVTEASAQYHVIVSIRPLYPGHARTVIQACWAAYPVGCKQVVVVEDDCNVYDPRDVDWHIATRVQPDRDIIIMGNCTGHSLDPSMPVADRAYGGKMGIDATRKIHYPPVSMPGKEYLRQVRKDWPKYGLPTLPQDLWSI